MIPFSKDSGSGFALGLASGWSVGMAAGLSAGLGAGYFIGSKSADYNCQSGGRICCRLTGVSMMLEGGLRTCSSVAKAISKRQVSISNVQHLAFGLALGFAGTITTLLPSMLSMESVVVSDDIVKQPLDEGLLPV